jgi:hypothetical protein
MTQPLPGLEHEAATLERLRPYRSNVLKQASKQIIMAALAEKLTGGHVALDWTRDGLMLEQANPGEDAGPGEALADRFATLLMLSAQDENHAVGVFDGNDGQTFEGSTTLWKSSLRLDPTWMEAMRRRTRKEAKERFQAMRERLQANPAEWVAYKKKDRSWSYGDRFMTLTMNKIEGACTFDEVKRFNAACRYLFKSKWWRSQTQMEGSRLPRILGGIKAMEDALSADGPHVHGHFLLIARRLDQDALHAEWTKAVELATAKIYGIKVGGFMLIKPDLRTVTKRHSDRSDCIGLEDALDEVCKYMTKPSDLLAPHINRAGEQVDPPDADVLLALCLVPRWPRMVEHLGAARKEAKPAQRPSLDTSCISVPAPRLPQPEYWEEGGIEPEERVAFRLKIAESVGYNLPRPPDKAPTWRQLMHTLSLHDWLQAIASRFRRGIEFRKRWLRSYNPNLRLITLSGDLVNSNEWAACE